MRILRNHWPALCLLLVLLLVSAVRLRLVAMPLERDEGEYGYAGQLILEGVPPYRLVYRLLPSEVQVVTVFRSSRRFPPA